MNVIPLATNMEIKMYEISKFGLYIHEKGPLGSLSAILGKAIRKKRFNARFKATFKILIIAYRVGFSLARSQANGMITSASKVKIHTMYLIYFESISRRFANEFLNRKAINRNAPVDAAIDIRDVETTVPLSAVLL